MRMCRKKLNNLLRFDKPMLGREIQSRFYLEISVSQRTRKLNFQIKIETN
jgi:hypothetical protein